MPIKLDNHRLFNEHIRRNEIEEGLINSIIVCQTTDDKIRDLVQFGIRAPEEEDVGRTRNRGRTTRAGEPAGSVRK